MFPVQPLRVGTNGREKVIVILVHGKRFDTELVQA